jgi:hypothetical protein
MNKHIEKFNMDVIEGVISSIKERFRAENKPEDVIDNLKKVYNHYQMWLEKLRRAYQRNKPPISVYPFFLKTTFHQPAKPKQDGKYDGNSGEDSDWEDVDINVKKEEKKDEKSKEEKKVEKPKEEEEKKEPVVDELISSDSNSDEEDDKRNNLDKAENNDRIFAQYEEVHRAKKKFKCKFLNVMMKLSSGDFVAPKATAEIDY